MQSTVTVSFSRAAFAAGMALVLVACRGGAGRDSPDASTATRAAEGLADGGASPRGAGGGHGDDVEPVYPEDPAAPIAPIAQKLCGALHDMPEQRRAACCGGSKGIVFTAECARTLSAALRGGAAELADADVDACLAALDATFAGCDWVGPFPPAPPAACAGIVHGKLASGRACRSSLECEGGLRCLGAGPTTKGRCGGPKADGELCGGTVDTLATYTRQADVDVRHPECKGACIKHHCAPVVGEGGACQSAKDCQPGAGCVASSDGGKQCVTTRPPVRKSTGETCTADFECRGGCLRDGGVGKGTCGPRCDVR